MQNCNTNIIVLQNCNNINTFFECYLYLPVFILNRDVCALFVNRITDEKLCIGKTRHMSEVRMSFNFVCNIGKPILVYIFIRSVFYL